ncbi:hypothetical protein FisN_13Hu148 [Fistulifera solaris]|uniref:N-acetyltransferase domain-containing protein n=1 Tax=Fistulifera solaris TaxID=1519565 RepID=A0A1Z5KP09_FISSO|nr:hypothetical protein FisN_13Hu148 [Fistulifera solaris]|eukprot:GAX27751.1 hypothetical protein FisN_13Hu148 [Fistulifera solaris]
MALPRDENVVGPFAEGSANTQNLRSSLLNFRRRRRRKCATLSLCSLLLITLFLTYKVDAFKVSFASTTPRRSSFLDAIATKSSEYRAEEQQSGRIPFVIEALPSKPHPRVYREISDMCIDAFFNDGGRKDNTAPWKEYQLAYLRTLQQGDLEQRRKQQAENNFMLVARTIVPAEDVEYNAPLLLDFDHVYNFIGNPQDDYVRGEVVGFVEVTQKPYGLGPYESNLEKRQSANLLSFLQKQENTADAKSPSSVRPFLTNLSVKYSARRSGVGSALAQRCEEEVLARWNKNEITLEVEDDNKLALEFYRKRGYEILFEDKTGRRYDTTGLWLQQKRF